MTVCGAKGGFKIWEGGTHLDKAGAEGDALEELVEGEGCKQGPDGAGGV